MKILASFSRKDIVVATIAASVSLASSLSSAQALEEVIVTAQKRAASLQDVPVTVSAFSAENIQAFNFENTADIAAKTPNMTIQPSGGGNPLSPSVYIRGQGQNAINITNDPSIAIYMDDIYVAKDSGSVADLVDMERIEVLKGPQGTLYGRNTTGGAVKYYSVRPDPDAGYEGFVTGDFGNYDYTRVQGALNIPLGNTVALRYAGSVQERDGYTTQMFLDGNLETVRKKELNDLESQYHRLNAIWQPSDNLSTFMSAYYSEADVNGYVNKNLAGDAVTLAGFTPLYKDFYTGARDNVNAFGDVDNSKVHSDSWGVSLDTTWDTSYGFEVQGILSYRDTDLKNDAFDIDGAAAQAPAAVGGVPLLTVRSTVPQEFTSFTAELQAKGLSFDDKLSWVTGLYYFEEEGDDASLTGQFVLGSTPAPLDQDAVGHGENDSLAVFAHLKYDLTDKIGIEGGLRWTRDNKALDGKNRLQFAGGPPLCTYNPDEPDVTNTTGVVGGAMGPDDICTFKPDDSWDYWSWSLGAQYRFTDNVMAYVKGNATQRAGGLQFRDASGEYPPYDEEKLTEYEVGVKSEMFNNRVRLNAAYFYGQYADYQYTIQPLTSQGTVTTATVNFGDADIQGFDLDLEIALLDELSLTAGGGRVEVDYDDEKFQQFNVPEYTGFVSLGYRPSFDFGEGLAQLSWTYKGSIEKQELKDVDQPYSKLPSVDLVDGRIGITLNNGIEVSLWGRNLMDEEYWNDALNFGGQAIIGYIGAPRTYALEVGYRW